MPEHDRPIRVLHYANQWSNQGGVESWLLNIFRLSDRDQVAHHLVVPAARYHSENHDRVVR